MRWNSDTSKTYTILDTSSTYISSGKGVINGTTITQVDNAINANVASKVYGHVGDTGSHELVRCDMNNDQFRIIAGSSSNNNGWAEIATADDGNEPIYVRQYTGVFSTLKRTLTLLDGNGNTIFPGSATAIGFNKSGSSNSYVLLGGGGHKLVSDFATSSHTHSWSSITNKPCTLISYSRNGENIDANNWRVKECSLIEIRNTELTYSNLAMSGFNSFFNFWTPDGIVCTQFQIGDGAFYYRSKQSGSWTITTNWYRLMDSNNCSVSKSGETLTVKINETSQSLTNTWRGI